MHFLIWLNLAENRITHAKTALTAALADAREPDAVLHLLRDDRPASDADLPHTGATLEWERLLSSAFVRDEDYGTRCSTLFRIDDGGGAVFYEWSWDRMGETSGTRRFEFAIEGGDAPSP